MEYLLSSIIIYYYLLSSIFYIYYHLFSTSIIIYYHLLSSIIIYYNLLSSIIIYYHLLSSIIIYYHLLSSIIIYCHLFSTSIIIYFLHLSIRYKPILMLTAQLLEQHRHLQDVETSLRALPSRNGDAFVGEVCGCRQRRRVEYSSGTGL